MKLLVRLTRLVAGIIFVVCAQYASAQPEVTFTLSKQVYAAGEPIFLDVAVKNVGSEPVEIYSADPLSFCGGFKFELKGAPDREASLCNAEGIFGSCLSGSRRIPPGASHVEHILLNRRFDLRQLGQFPLHVTYSLSYGAADDDLAHFDRTASHQEFSVQLEVALKASDDENLKPIFDEYFRALQSKNPETMQHAAEVFAYLAPPFAESTIEKMLDSSQLKEFGVIGLRNLGTPAAHHALTAYVKNIPATEVTGPDQSAIRFLGEIGDSSDIAPLLEVADAFGPESYNSTVAIESAGQVGGEDAVPLLISLLNSKSIDTRQAAVRALYLSGARSAVAVLIGLLRSPEERLSGTAEFGLKVLTHRSAAKESGSLPLPGSVYPAWTHWWNVHGSTAPVFKETECGETLPLE